VSHLYRLNGKDARLMPLTKHRPRTIKHVVEAASKKRHLISTSGQSSKALDSRDKHVVITSTLYEPCFLL